MQKCCARGLSGYAFSWMCSKYSCSSWAPWHSSTQRLWHWGSLPCSAPGGSWPPPAVLLAAGTWSQGTATLPSQQPACFVVSLLGLAFSWFGVPEYHGHKGISSVNFQRADVLIILQFPLPFLPYPAWGKGRDFFTNLIFCLSLKGMSRAWFQACIAAVVSQGQHLVRKTLTLT